MRDEKRSTGFEDEIIGVKGPGYSQGACQGNPEANRDAEEFQAGELGHQGRCFILETPTAPAGSVYRRTPPSRLGRALRSSAFKYDLVEMVTYFCKKRWLRFRKSSDETDHRCTEEEGSERQGKRKGSTGHNRFSCAAALAWEGAGRKEHLHLPPGSWPRPPPPIPPNPTLWKTDLKEKNKPKFNNMCASCVHGRDPGTPSSSLNGPGQGLKCHLQLRTDRGGEGRGCRHGGSKAKRGRPAGPSLGLLH